MSEYVIWKTERTDEMTTIQKTADLTNAARGAVARAIAELKPYVDQDLIAGAITKLQVLATAPPLEKADRLAAMSAEELTERLTMLRKAEAEAGPLSMRDRAGVQNAAADLETTYFAETNPRAAQAFVDRHEWQHRNDRPVAVKKASTAFQDAVAAARRDDPSLSEYQAAERVIRDNPDLARQVWGAQAG